MNCFSAKRVLVFFSLLAFASAAFAAKPSARYETKMAYDAANRRMILFGGLTVYDAGTKQQIFLNDTWQWMGVRWVQLFPAHAPSGRSDPMMVADPVRNRIVLFGGHTGATQEINDTWIFNGADWIQLTTSTAPSARYLAGASYDPLRDRIVLFGGIQTSVDPKTTVVSNVNLYDTWEFDGTTWTKIGGEGPHVIKPELVYDEAHSQTLMLGIDDKGATLMYKYDATAGTWSQVTGTTLPKCVNEGQLVYDTTNAAPLFNGGVCTNDTTTANETMEWDGSKWNAIDLQTNDTGRIFGAAAAYDIGRDDAVVFGGNPVGGTPSDVTYVFTKGSGWLAINDTQVPGRRSLFGMVTDPGRGLIWLFGGQDEFSTFDDLWQFQNGIWTQSTVTDNAPAGCVVPAVTFDTDRQKLIVLCGGSDVHEWDGTAWNGAPATVKTVPPARRFSSMTYDQTLKKTVLFGGYDGSNYMDETWTWDGTVWTRIKSNPAPSRILASMWWDPTLKKTVIYGGLGRLTSDDRLTRFDDMWTFDGNGWTQLKPASGTPGARYGAQVAVDPRNGHVILFGGIKVKVIPPTPPATVPLEEQFYANDTWQWDGTAWTQLTTDGAPPVRENAGFAFDPSLNTMVLYGGWAGYYLSDMWTLNGTTWRVRPEATGIRRRAAGR